MALSLSPMKEAEGESITPNWLYLPRDLTQNILQRLDVVEIVTSASLVCPLWWNICKEPLMWRTIHMDDHHTAPYDLESICMYAINRSCGQVEEIDIEDFGTDGLLDYIANCSSHLRSLRVAQCWGKISYQGFSKVAMKLPMLEEFDISCCGVSEDTLEVIGRCCPLLRSLKLNTVFFKNRGCEDGAFAIAKTMPNLRCLQISGDQITNVGLLAILDSCPLLESLDLRFCSRLDISGSFGKRCSDQIKDLLLPECLGYAYDYEYGYYLDSEYQKNLILQGLLYR